MGPSNKTLSHEMKRASAERAGTPHLFLVLSCDRPGAAAMRCSLEHVDEVMLGRADSRGTSRGDGSGVPRLTVGVGPAPEVEKLTVRWPSGAVTTRENVKTNQAVRIVEGE